MIIKTDINFGDEAKDCITGFAGIVTAMVEYSTGCRRYELTRKKLSDNGTVVDMFIDESRLIVTKVAGIPKVSKTKGKREGPQKPPAGLSNP
jgi:hypothetical protein